jgi:Niemann-Pick C1 protein
LTQSIHRGTRLPDEDIETQISCIVGRVGPAMLLTSVSESIAFFRGVLTPMPAVRLFSQAKELCSTNAPAKAQCNLCTNSTTHEQVTEKEFRDYLPFFLHDNPNLKCPKGGHAAHGSSVKPYQHNGTEETSVNHELSQSADQFRGFHRCDATRLSNCNELFFLSLSFTHSLSFASIFYAFDEQYSTIWHDAFMNLAISATVIFVVTFILLGFDIISAFIITLTIAI